MKRILISFLLVPLLWSCKQEGFDYRPAEVTVDQITRLDFFVGTDRMIADGRARLDFIVDAYTTVETTDADNNPTTMEVLINPRALPEDAITIHKADGTEVGWTYSTDDPSPLSVTFYAQAGSVESAEKTVTLRPSPTLPEKRYVDVIFHYFEQNPAEPTYNPLSSIPLTYEELAASIEPLNRVINNMDGTNPNGTSANIEFRLAKVDPTGKIMTQPGLNRIVYTSAILPSAVNPASYFAYMNGDETGTDGTSRVWDATKYLNIVVCDGPASTFGQAMITLPPPAYQVVPDDGMALDYNLRKETGASAEFTRPALGGMPAYVRPEGEVVTLPLTPEQEASAMNADNTCLLVPVSLFRPGLNKSVALSPYIGAWYGLFSTKFSTATLDDFCDDTQNYVPTPLELNTLIKVSLTGEKFFASNATDDLLSASLRNNFTLDQIARIRYTMDNCPGKQNGLTE